ncbi:hypothetical protein [Dietzia cinnamea]|uniref:hypothetical protein n=1 Tax=Dietzia cinnamea TaxID=321318 RepID=UPI00223AA5EC|nr:hypothetical protein [Dietzia cinnamea]MCT2077968.1 hypothetical protein [Dietzia cinnamea]MCT2219893.1 hypothetical protein [Dietzia cinnamea]
MIPDPDTFASARCVGRWTEWETDALDGEGPVDRLERLRWAATQCGQCTAFSACRTLADQTPHKHRAHHVWAGTVPPIKEN